MIIVIHMGENPYAHHTSPMTSWCLSVSWHFYKFFSFLNSNHNPLYYHNKCTGLITLWKKNNEWLQKAKTAVLITTKQYATPPTTSCAAEASSVLLCAFTTAVQSKKSLGHSSVSQLQAWAHPSICWAAPHSLMWDNKLLCWMKSSRSQHDTKGKEIKKKECLLCNSIKDGMRILTAMCPCTKD